MNAGRLTRKQHDIAVLAATETLQNKEIAQRIGVHPNAVTRVLKMPEVQVFIKEMQKQIQEKTVTNLVQAFDQASMEAFQKLIDLMRQSPSPSVALRAVESILDRSRMAPKRQIHSQQNVEGKVMHVHIGEKEMRRIHDVMIEADGAENVPELPEMPNGEYVVEIDSVTGQILREGNEL